MGVWEKDQEDYMGVFNILLLLGGKTLGWITKRLRYLLSPILDLLCTTGVDHKEAKISAVSHPRSPLHH